MIDHEDLTHVLAGRELLSHPFYRRWEAGQLGDGELASYGAQYAHFERQLPITLAEVADRCQPGTARNLVEANLDDELHHPQPHVELLESFLAAVGSTVSMPTDATARLVSLYREAPRRGVAFALGVLAAYEVQAAGVARTKSVGLRSHYGLGADGTQFWDVHAEMEEAHATWTLDAAEALDRSEVLDGVAASRDAWWSFLDDRDAALAPV